MFSRRLVVVQLQKAKLNWPGVIITFTCATVPIQLLLHVTSLQFLSMLLLTSQQTVMPLLVRSASKSHSFLPSTSVFLMEVMKLTACLLAVFANEGFYWKPFAQRIQDDILDKGKETLKVGVPAFVYALQNNLYYISLENIDAATYSVTYQLRILTTAVLAVVILNKRLSGLQWLALFCSLIGVIGVQLDGAHAQSTSLNKGNWLIGFGAVFSMCWTSAFAGVYFEKMLKTPNADMWIQNLRLSIMTLFFATAGMLLTDGEKISHGGFFQGWIPLVWVITIINSVGGLAVSAVMKHADNVKKTYCQSIAVGLTSIISILLGERVLTLLLSLGVGLVILSVYVYASYPPEKEKEARGNYQLLEQKLDETV